MISSIHGAVEHVGLDHAVVVVGGVGLLVHTTPGTAAGLRRGEQASLSTTLVVREDSLTLYGFATPAEREMFETVQTVSGIGPRLALAMLSVMSPEEVRTALGAGDALALTKIPGVGRKSAERLILELRDKVGAVAPAAESLSALSSTRHDQVVEALVGLGWNARAAGDAVTKVSAGAGPEADLASILRLALRELGR